MVCIGDIKNNRNEEERMTHHIDFIVAIMESIALNYSIETRHDRRYLRSRLKTLKLALKDCFQWELTKGQATIIKGELRYVNKFKLGQNGKLHFNTTGIDLFRVAIEK